ncbi:GNAT family N-acetyltransferase [Pararhodobacter sp.]|uniref:GNAT family N-acetyltransferase n=1 Tax=Pararhodobacter sp. TaxID=2127056 RepID=UPI002AFF7105|nr:GNAT family N-acetyltransferase [Pararhodobacter sp.]
MQIRRPVEQDRAAWERLYADYAAFYEVEQTPLMRDRVWGWIQDPAHEVSAFVAEDTGGALVGLTHFRPYFRPLAAAVGGFLDDLFVDPAARGSGAARALIEAVAEEGRRLGWTKVRWITAEDNARARALYDKLATATTWKTYDIDL